MLCHSAIFSTPPPQTVSLSLFISFLWVFFSGKCFLSKTNQVTNKPQLCIQLRFPPSQDSDDDGSVHLGEVLASQTAARAPPGAPANAVPGPLGRSGGLKQAVVGIVGLEDVLFNRFFQAFFFFWGSFTIWNCLGSYFFDWPILSNELRLHVLLLLQGVGSQLALSHFASFTWGVRYSECHPLHRGKSSWCSCANGAMCEATTWLFHVARWSAFLVDRCRASKACQPVWTGVRDVCLKIAGWPKVM